MRLTAYAKSKLVFLREHGFPVSEAAVVQTVRQPSGVSRGHGGRWVAQRPVSERHLLRVVYEDTAQEQVVVTIYPARRSRYESPHDV